MLNDISKKLIRRTVEEGTLEGDGYVLGLHGGDGLEGAYRSSPLTHRLVQ